MSEGGMRSRVLKLLKSLDAIPVENPALPGTPDVNYVEGWAELKWLRSWPKRTTTVVQVKHFTRQQRIRHVQRRRAGGRSWVILQCKREWLVLDGVTAAYELGFSTRNQLIGLAVGYWPKGVDQKELVQCICQPVSVYSWTAEDVERLSDKLQDVTVYQSAVTQAGSWDTPTHQPLESENPDSMSDT